MILLNHTVDVTGIFMANNIHIERQRYTLFIYGKRPGTKKRLNYNPQNEKMQVSETKGLKNPQIPKTKRLLFIQTHKRQRKPKQPVSLPFVLYIQFKSNIIFTANQTDSLINVILVNMDITKV